MRITPVGKRSAGSAMYPLTKRSHGKKHLPTQPSSPWSVLSTWRLSFSRPETGLGWCRVRQSLEYSIRAWCGEGGFNCGENTLQGLCDRWSIGFECDRFMGVQARGHVSKLWYIRKWWWPWALTTLDQCDSAIPIIHSINAFHPFVLWASKNILREPLAPIMPSFPVPPNQPTKYWSVSHPPQGPASHHPRGWRHPRRAACQPASRQIWLGDRTLIWRWSLCARGWSMLRPMRHTLMDDSVRLAVPNFLRVRSPELCMYVSL